MLVISILYLIVAISLNYFNISPHAGQVTTILWKRLAIILLIICLPLAFEGRICQDSYLFNGLLLISNHLTNINCLIFITSIILITNLTPGTTSKGYSERLVFIICAVTGGIILTTGTDILTILLGLELQSYSVYVLAASYRNYEPSEAAGLKYFLLGALSSALIFMGFALLYCSSGTTQFQVTLIETENILIPYSALTLILAGISFKIAAAPLHGWSIDVYDAVPTKTTAILSLLPKIALFSFVVKLISMLTPYSSASIFLVIFIIILSLVIGSIAGLFQPRIKRLLAYSSVLNVGFILLGALLTNSTMDDINPIFYIIQYLLTTAATWLCLINFANIFMQVEVSLTTQLQGTHSKYLSTNTTILAICTTILIFSTAGIPPMVGFFAKFSIIWLSIQSGYLSLAIIAIVASIISTIYYLNIIKIIWSSNEGPTRLIIKSMEPTIQSLNLWAIQRENSLVISFITLIVAAYLLQYSVVLIFLSCYSI